MVKYPSSHRAEIDLCLKRSKRRKIMKLWHLMIIKAVICLAFGLGMVLIPSTLMDLYGMALGAEGLLMTRLLGCSFLLLATLLFLARKDPGSDSLTAIVLGVIVGDTIGFVVALVGQISGVVNALGWTTVLIYLLLALGFAYFQFIKPRDTLQQ
jgi:hypothetical protein